MAFDKINNQYRVDIYCNGRRIRKRLGTNKKRAEEEYYKLQAQAAEGVNPNKKKEYKLTFSEMAKRYLEGYAIANKKSSKRDEQLLKNLEPFLGKKKLVYINSIDIEKYRAERLKKVKKSTINREVSCLRAVYNKAIEWKLAEENPVKNIKFYSEEEFKRFRYLEEDEINRLLENCNSQHLKDIVEVALNTGMRYSEILNLMWSNVDLASNVIILKNTKSKKVRSIPINYRIKNIFERRKKDKSNKGYVFCYKDGENIKSMRTSFEKAVEDANIKDFKFHDLRHTFASHLVKNNVKLLTVKELLGHSTLEMTLRYAHLAPNEKTEAVEKLYGHFLDTEQTIEIIK